MENLEHAPAAIDSVIKSRKAFCKFLSANDTGKTGAHQCGVFIPHSAYPLIFDTPGVKGTNKDRQIHIVWHGGEFETDSRAIYYGVRTRNEYRITRYGAGFPFFRPEFTGALLVLTWCGDDEFEGFVLNTEDDIDYFLGWFGLTPADTNRLIGTSAPVESSVITDVVKKLHSTFPDTAKMSELAREIDEKVSDHRELIVSDPDSKLDRWTKTEYRLFQALEKDIYLERVRAGFADLTGFIRTASEILNKRKSRAGKSLEHHLAEIFRCNGLPFESQVKTEGGKQPDFIFPSGSAYHDITFPSDRLMSLAAKTTCKDRWRQILNEADRLRGSVKYLCTLQQGISATQLQEMSAEKVVLVVPRMYISAYPKAWQGSILSIRQFVERVKATMP